MIQQLWSGEKYTTDELNARLKFFIGIILGLTLFGIVFVVLFSLIFVTQPMNGMSPVDNKFFELIIPVATFLTGTLSGIMLAGDDKDLRGKAIDAATKPYTPPPPPPVAAPAPGFSPAPSFSAAPMAAAPAADAVQMVNGKPAPVQPAFPEI
jgi:Na+-transporting methylmalonyl-CoA/oxaloacetate decarboxylase gamma subunit